MTHMTISAVLLLCFHTYKNRSYRHPCVEQQEVKKTMQFAAVGIGSNSYRHLSAGYTVTKDYRVVASRWKITCPRMEKSAFNKEHVSNHQQSFFYIPP